MKIISNKSYKEYNELKFNATHYYEPEIDRLKKQLEEAKNLKSILENITGKGLITGNGITLSGTCFQGTLDLGENVLVYVDDILGGKVIKQEGNKCIVIDENGNVKTGLTKQEVDKGFKYKLVRTPNNQYIK